MSIQDERPHTGSAGNGLARTGLLGIGSILLMLFAGQILLQHYIAHRVEEKEGPVFEDQEQLKKLREITFKDTVKTATDWPQWRGPNRDGVSTETGLATAWPETGPRKLWEAAVGQGYSAPVISQGRVYGFFLDQDQETVVCWNAENGEELWKFRYPAAYRNEFGNGPRSTPAVEGDLLFTVGGTGMMHCLRTHPKTPEGEVVWTKDLLAEFKAPNLKWGVSFSPLVMGNRVFVCPGGPNGKSIAALDKNTGEVLWQALDDHASFSSPIAVTCAGQPQILFVTAERLVGVTPDKGELLWSFPWVTNADGCTIATPIFVQDYVFISSGYGKGCALMKIEKTAEGFQARKVYENGKMRNHHSSSVRLGDQLYGFNENILTCLEMRTGMVLWKERGLAKGSLTIADGHLIILDQDGTLALAEASPRDYQEKARWQTGLKHPCWIVPVVAGARLYIRDQERLLCLDLRP